MQYSSCRVAELWPSEHLVPGGGVLIALQASQCRCVCEETQRVAEVLLAEGVEEGAGEGQHLTPRAPGLSSSRASRNSRPGGRGPGPGPYPSHPQTHPEEGGETLAVVSNGKVVCQSEDFHDVFIEFCLLDLKEENSQLVTPQCVLKAHSAPRGQDVIMTQMCQVHMFAYSWNCHHNSDIFTLFQIILSTILPVVTHVLASPS